MPKIHKLGLSRSRVFALENCVTFSGDFVDGVNGKTLSDALKILQEKYPLVSCTLELREDGEAYAVENANVQVIRKVDADIGEFLENIRRDGLDFTKELFSFYFINGKTLVIAGHTAVCDVRSLALLACDLASLCLHKPLSAARCEVELLSKISDLPANATTGIAGRVSNSLNYAWVKNGRVFSAEDYRTAFEKYASSREERKTVSLRLTKDETEKIAEACRAKNADIASAGAFFVYEALKNKFGVQSKNGSVLWQCNERLFLGENEVYGVGPFNSVSTVKVPAKSKKGILPFDAFQDETYKKHATCFNAFYDSVFLAEILPSLCDAAHLYEAGAFANRTAKSLAEKDFCLRESLLGCSFLNFDQQYWQRIKAFSNVRTSEPFSRRMRYNLNMSLADGELLFELCYRSGEQNESVMNSVLENAVNELKKL